MGGEPHAWARPLLYLIPRASPHNFLSTETRSLGPSSPVSNPARSLLTIPNALSSSSSTYLPPLFRFLLDRCPYAITDQSLTNLPARVQSRNYILRRALLPFLSIVTVLFCPTRFLSWASDCFSDGDGFELNDDDRVLSPTLTGTTIDNARSTSPRDTSGNATPVNGRRRAPPPPNLDLDPPVMPNGLLRSTRPSVSEWGRGSDGEPVSPDSDEAHLNPYENSTISPRSPGSIRMGRQRARESLGMDFMTSALHEEREQGENHF